MQAGGTKISLATFVPNCSDSSRRLGLVRLGSPRQKELLLPAVVLSRVPLHRLHPLVGLVGLDCANLLVVVRSFLQIPRRRRVLMLVLCLQTRRHLRRRQNPLSRHGGVLAPVEVCLVLRRKGSRLIPARSGAWSICRYRKLEIRLCALLRLFWTLEPVCLPCPRGSRVDCRRSSLMRPL